MTAQTDPQGNETDFDYSGMNFTTGTGDTVVADPDGNETDYAYAGNVLVSVAKGYGSASPSQTYYVLDVGAACAATTRST